MAKKPATVGVNSSLLATIAAATAAGGFHYISKADGDALISEGLIEVNTGMLDESGNAAARTTEKGSAMAGVGGSSEPTTAPVSASGGFAIIDNAELPKVTRKGGGGNRTAKYPFEGMTVGASFFVSNDDVESGDALKTLNATVANWNEKFKEDTGETKTVTRSVRGKDRKSMLGEDGKPVMETVTIPVKRSLRKFAARPVSGGKAYGAWTAPADGVLVSRTA